MGRGSSRLDGGGSSQGGGGAAKWKRQQAGQRGSRLEERRVLEEGREMGGDREAWVIGKT